jgi:hypothetical protein
VAAISAFVVTWLTTRPAASMPQARCGSAVTHGLDGHTQLLRADPGALSCFSAAVRACKPGSIKVTEMGVDTGTDYVFTIEPGGTTCRVTEVSQAYSANFGGSQGPVYTTSCRRTAVTGAGVTLSCDGRDVFIPARVSVP